jgi:hypothetical protein
MQQLAEEIESRDRASLSISPLYELKHIVCSVCIGQYLIFVPHPQHRSITAMNHQQETCSQKEIWFLLGRMRSRVPCRQVSGFQRQPPDFGLVFPLINERIRFSRLAFLIRSRLRARRFWASSGTSTVSIRVDDPKSSVLPVCDKTLQKFQGRSQIRPIASRLF